MLDVPKDIKISHKIDAKDLTIKVALYDEEKKTVCGVPLAGIIGGGIFVAAVLIITHRRPSHG